VAPTRAPVPARPGRDDAGRHPDSDIFLDDVTVSRRHAEFRREGGGFVVHDVGSLNGTYVNRQRIDVAALAAATRCRSASSGCSTSRAPGPAVKSRPPYGELHGANARSS
jgi:pSer/pThr/pTyr-binding forkhead associated (FHA) protein